MQIIGYGTNFLYSPKIINNDVESPNNNIRVTSTQTNSVSFNSLYINPINKFKNFSMDEYNKLSNSEKNYLRRMSSNRIQNNTNEFINIHESAASLTKQVLDKKYGEGNYVVISIGRSLSSISKTLSYQIGEDNVKQIPLSNAGRFQQKLNFDNNDDINKFKEYLDSIGLSKNEIETSGKNYLIMDYCESGKSLNGAYNLLTSDDVWGKQSNVNTQDFVKLFYDIDEEVFRKNNIPDKYYFLDDLEIIFLQCLTKKFATISRCGSLSDTINSRIQPKNMDKEQKYFWFKIMDDISTKKENIYNI